MNFKRSNEGGLAGQFLKNEFMSGFIRLEKDSEIVAQKRYQHHGERFRIEEIWKKLYGPQFLKCVIVLNDDKVAIREKSPFKKGSLIKGQRWANNRTINKTLVMRYGRV